MPEKNTSSSRRKFLQQLSATTLALTTGSLTTLAKEEEVEKRIIQYERKVSANDKVNIGVIGLGIMGYNDVNAAIKVPGVQLVAACDLYDGRLEHAKELFGNDLYTTKDYRQILDRKDIDAVIIATTDLWHARITKEALQKGKHVYCEKPMVHRISEGMGVVKGARCNH